MDKYKKITMTLPENLFTRYKKLIKTFGMNLSARITILIGKDIKDIEKMMEIK